MKKLALVIGFAAFAAVLIRQFLGPGTSPGVMAISIDSPAVSTVSESAPVEMPEFATSGSSRSRAQADIRGGPEQKTARARPRRSMSGKVLSFDTLEPIEGATIKAVLTRGARPQQFATTRSGPDGSYELDLSGLPELPELSIQNADVELVVWAEGYQPSTEYYPFETLLGDLEDVETLLGSGRTLRGRVLKPTGEAAANGHVMLLTANGGSSTSVRSCSVDGDGEFFIALLEGHFPTCLIATLDGFTPARLDLSDRLLSKHEDLGDLVLGWGAVMRGRATCGDGTPLTGIEVTAHVSTPVFTVNGIGIGAFWTATTDQHGFFQIEGLDGEEFTIKLGGEEFGPAKPKDFDFNFVISKSLFSFFVEDEHGQALVDLNVELTFGGAKGAEFWVGDYGDSYTNLPDGRVDFWNDPYPEVLISVPLSGQHVYRQRIALDPNVCFQEIKFIVPSKAPLGQLYVELTDPGGEPVQDVAIELHSLLDSAPLEDLSGAGPHEVMSGRYSARIFSAAKRFVYCPPVVLPEVEIVAGEKLRLQCKLETGGLVAIEIVPQGIMSSLEKGRDAAITRRDKIIRSFVRVKARDSAGEAKQWSFTMERGTDGFGAATSAKPHLSKEALTPGPYVFDLSVGGYEPIQVKAMIRAGEVTSLRVEVFPEDGPEGG